MFLGPSLFKEEGGSLTFLDVKNMLYLLIYLFNKSNLVYNTKINICKRRGPGS